MRKINSFFILSNSPGELAGWVVPVVREIKKQNPSANIQIFLLPCQFKSGQEKQFAEKIKGVNKVWDVSETLKFCFKGFHEEIKRQNGVILFLGGDQFYGLRFKKNLGWPLFVYTMTRARYPLETTGFFVPHQKIKETLISRDKIPAEKIFTVGDLMVDAVDVFKDEKVIKNEFQISENKFILTFMPGSRFKEFRYLFPFFLEVAKILFFQDDRFECVFSISDFISDSLLWNFLSEFEVFKISDFCFRIKKGNFEAKITRYVFAETLKITDLLITIPGTNTQQAGFLGIPMIVILPLNRPEELQFEGLFGLFGNLPFLGKFIKKIAIYFLSKKKNFFALPNISAKKFVVPEIVGIVDAPFIAGKIFELSYDKLELERMKKELKIISPQKGASERMVNYILSESYKNGN